jgi:hypothetical protein
MQTSSNESFRPPESLSSQLHTSIEEINPQASSPELTAQLQKISDIAQKIITSENNTGTPADILKIDVTALNQQIESILNPNIVGASEPGSVWDVINLAAKATGVAHAILGPTPEVHKAATEAKRQVAKLCEIQTSLSFIHTQTNIDSDRQRLATSPYPLVRNAMKDRNISDIQALTRKKQTSLAIEIIQNSPPYMKKELASTLISSLGDQSKLAVLIEAPPSIQLEIFIAIIAHSIPTEISKLVNDLPEDLFSPLLDSTNNEDSHLSQADRVLAKNTLLAHRQTPTTSSKISKFLSFFSFFSFKKSSTAESSHEYGRLQEANLSKVGSAKKTSLIARLFGSFSFIKKEQPPPHTNTATFDGLTSNESNSPRSSIGSADGERDSLSSKEESSLAETASVSSNATSNEDSESTSSTLSEKSQSAFSNKSSEVSELKSALLDHENEDMIDLFSSMIGGQEIQSVRKEGDTYTVTLKGEHVKAFAEKDLPQVGEIQGYRGLKNSIFIREARKKQMRIPKTISFSIETESYNKKTLHFKSPNQTILLENKPDQGTITRKLDKLTVEGDNVTMNWARMDGISSSWTSPLNKTETFKNQEQAMPTWDLLWKS